MKNLFINIGNTWTTFLYEGKEIKKRTSNLAKSLSDFSQSLVVYIASVVPEANDTISKYFGQSYFLNASNCGLDLSQINDSSSIGADRLANALGSCYLYKNETTLIIDCGSCFTGELVTKERQFLGGFIFPGRQFQRDILFQNTGNLPQLNVSGGILSKTLGQNTKQAIEIGIDKGIVGNLRYLIDDIQEAYVIDNLCFIGGDGELYQSFFSNSLYIENLTLQGLKFWQKNGDML